jgi:hypothetical protein
MELLIELLIKDSDAEKLIKLCLKHKGGIYN